VISRRFAYRYDCPFSGCASELEGQVKAVVFWGIVLTMGRVNWAAGQDAQLVLRVHDLTGLSAPDLAAAVGETARIFRAARIELIWTEAGSAETSTIPAVAASIISSARPDSPWRVLGRALPFPRSGVRVTLFLDAIRAQAMETAIPLPILLGHALGHELGHVILGAGPADHRFPGLMRAQWGPLEFDRIRHGALKFSRIQAAALRRTIAEGLSESPPGAQKGWLGELRNETWPRAFGQ
jgi:hypothetical protein